MRGRRTDRAGCRPGWVGFAHCAAALALIGAAASARAQTVDQQNLGTSGSRIQIFATQALGQEFVPGFAEHLAIDVLLVDTNSGAAAPDITLNLREDSIAGNILASVIETPFPLQGGTEDMFRFAFDSPVFLDPGETYVIELLSTMTTRGSWSFTSGDEYAAGRGILSGIPDNGGLDFVFQTIVMVPEPETALLLGMGLLLLAAPIASRPRG